MDLLKYAVTAASAAMLATPAHAAAIVIPDSGDTAWLLASLMLGLAAALPAIMLLFAAVYGRAYAPRILAASVSGMAIVALATVVIGYSLMFDVTTINSFSAFIGGGTNKMLALMGTLRDGTTVPETAFVAFQLGFVLLAVTLLSSVLAPRARPGWLLGFTLLWFLLVLVPITRWIWGGGWLEAMGALDASGGLTIFYATSVSALVAMLLVGTPEGKDAPADPAMLLGGAALLLLGMLAFGSGATLGAGDNAAVALLSTLICAATGSLTLAAVRRSLDPATLALGLIAGTVGAASAGDSPSPGGAIWIGFLVALAVAITPRLLPKRIGWHDKGALVTSIAAAAKTGALLTAIFLSFDIFGGSGYPEGMDMIDQLVAQMVAIVAIAAWSAFGTAIAALMVGMIVPMRAEKAK